MIPGTAGREAAERMRAFSEREERRACRAVCMAKKVESWWAALPPPERSTTVRILRNFALASTFASA